MHRTLSGDRRAFEELVERHRDAVFRVAARVVGRQEAEDVSQEALVRAYHRLGRWRGEGRFRAWLLQITHNVALDAVARRRPAGPDEPADEPAEVESRGPVATLEHKERLERLERKLALLQPNHRAVLVLRDLEGLSYADIATITAAPLGSVKGRLHRARSELIELLRRNAYDWELPDG